MDKPISLDDLERLETAATRAPWAKMCHGNETALGGSQWWTVNRAVDSPQCLQLLQSQICRVLTATGDDAALIAESRNALPALTRIARAALAVQDAEDSFRNTGVEPQSGHMGTPLADAVETAFDELREALTAVVRK